MIRKRYAETLENIASQGATAFYNGPMADATIAAVHKNNGSMTLDDLHAYNITPRKPLAIDYKGYHIASCGAPASGAVALSIMKVVEGFDSFGSHDSVNLSTHRLDEAMRFGYGKVSRY